MDLMVARAVFMVMGTVGISFLLGLNKVPINTTNFILLVFGIIGCVFTGLTLGLEDK